MGREARVRAEVGGEAGEVKALLEAHELILRGEIRRRFPKAEMEGVAVDGDLLRFCVAGEAVALHLGGKIAQSWATAILKEPPGLRTKLGLDKGAKALLIGVCDDAALAAALEGALTEDTGEASMVVARIDGPGDLDIASAACGTRPLWTIYPKGKVASFGDAAIRTALREAGWRDTKSCAISDRLTATRYNRA